MNDELDAKPGRPGRHGGKRIRWRHVVRETRATNRPAVARIADAEIALKRKLARSVAIGNVLRGVLIGGAFATVIIMRGCP